MSGRSSPRRIALATAGLILACAARSGAQPFERYAVFGLDSVFRIGAHTVPGYASFARDTLKLDFTYHYQPTWDNLGVGELASRILTPRNILDTLDRDLYLQAGVPDSLALRTAFIPDVLKVMGGYLTVTDSYPYDSPELQMLDFEARNGDLLSYPAGNDATMLKTISLPPDSAGLLIGQPRYVSTVGFRRSDSARYCNSMKYPFFDIGRGDSARGNDSSYMVRIGLHMRVDSLQGTFGLGTVIAKVILWRRLTIDTCRCAIYEPFRRVDVTYGMYLDANRLRKPLDQFKDVGVWLDIRDSTGLGWHNPVDGLYYRSMLGSWIGGPDTASAILARCQRYLDTLKATGKVDSTTELRSSTVLASDVYYDLHTNGTAKITFLRGRVAPHEFEALLNHRFDSLIANEVRALFQDTATAIIRRRLFRLGLYDEPSTTTFEALSYLSDTMQALILRYSPSADSGRPWLYQNPVANYDGFRRLQFDLDPTLPKRAHMLTRQQLAVIQAPVPVFYVRPDKMLRGEHNSTAWQAFYPPDSITGLVAYNSESGYRRYTEAIQKSLGRFRDHTTYETSGALVPSLARMIDVAKFKYAGVMPDSAPVYNVVTCFGAPGFSETGGFTSGWIQGVRPKTPEEIAVQSFLSFFGAQGMEFDELSWNGRNLGIADRIHGVRLINWSAPCASWPSRTSTTWDTCDCGEWDTLQSSHPNDTVAGGAPDPKWSLPQMWVGLHSRHLATRRIVGELRRIAPVYQRLYFKMEQMSVHDTVQSFDEIPMVANLQMQRPVLTRRDSLVPDVTPAGIDSRAETYAELAHFYPGRYDTLGTATSARYAAVCNRRTWPIDDAAYGSVTRALAWNDDSGRGFIDVRRPVITLKNSTNVMADSFLIEKVGHEDSLHWRVRIDSAVALDWLEPGWGGLYRITPIAAPVSTYATTYPNAVRSVNLDTTFVRDGVEELRVRRLVAYDRDSVVYLRGELPGGGWMPEIMVSDSSDIDEYGSSLAYNYNPSISVVAAPRGDHAETHEVVAMVVWERHAFNPADTAHVVGRIYALTWFPDSVIDVVISPDYATASLDARGIRMTPAIVGVPSRHDSVQTNVDDGGFAVAWATPQRQIAMRFVNAHSGDVSSEFVPVRSPAIIALTSDSTCSYPSLAFGRTRHEKMNVYDAVHLAFQQGVAGARNHILYCQVRLAPLDSGVLTPSPRRFVASSVEQVSMATNGCSFLHPCVAADTARVGVAFEVQGASSSIALKFRAQDTTVTPWNTTTYRWGSRDTLANRMWPPWLTAVTPYTWPSLAHFPALPAADVIGRPLGALAWQWVAGSIPQRNRQRLYWYGRSQIASLANGQFANLVLAPFVDSFAVAPYAGGVVYRGVQAESTSATSIRGTPTYHYPLYLRPIAEPSNLMGGYGGLIAQAFEVRQTLLPQSQQCAPYGMSGVLVAATPSAPPQTPTTKPFVSPRFFRAPALDSIVQPSIELAMDVARTSTFIVGEDPVLVTRYVIGGPGLLEWLDDSSKDVGVVTELLDARTRGVLWRSDTISGRQIGEGVEYGEVSVPAPEVAEAGDSVFIRLRPIVLGSLDYNVTTDFLVLDTLLGTGSSMMNQMLGSDSSDEELLKAGRMRHVGMARTSASALAVAVRPNPARGELRVTIEALEPGAGTIELVDGLGRRLWSEPIEIGEPGSWVVPLSVERLTPAIYTVVVTINGTSVPQRFAVVR